MTTVYDVYVWKCGKLEWTAHDIVASGDKQAAMRSVSALRSRPDLRTEPTLQALSRHLYGHGPCPENTVLQVVKKVDRPTQTCVVSG